MKRTFVLLLVGGLALAACVHDRIPSAQASAPSVTQPRTAGAFSRIELRAPVDVFVREGHPAAMALATSGIAPAKITTRVVGDALVVDVDHDWCVINCNDNWTARIDVDVPVLNGVKLSGSGDVSVAGAGQHAKLDVEVKGSGDVHYEGATADVVACHIEGSGDVKLSGSGKRIEASLEGSGDMDARAFAVSGGGSFEIDGSGNVTANLHGGESTIRLHGSGDLRYEGDTRITSLEISGSGEVSHL
jgi:hypothetical protein